MQLRLEYIEKKEELQPALVTLHEAIDGNAFVRFCLFEQTTCITLEIFASKLLKKVFYVILVTGNMINAVRDLVYMFDHVICNL